MTIVGLNGILANRCQQILTNKFQHDSNNDRVCGRYNKLACGVDNLQISDLGALPALTISTPMVEHILGIPISLRDEYNL